MSNITVVEREGALVVDSRLVAERLGVEHDNFLQTVRSYQPLIEQAFGILLFETEKTKGRGRSKKFAFLSEDQATFVMTLSRNTPQVVQCKLELVQAFSEAKRELKKLELPPQTPASLLSKLEADIQEGLNMVEQGKALVWQAVARIQAERLWKLGGFANFEDYCRKRWGWADSNAWEIAQAGRVTAQLQQIGIPLDRLPRAVSQIRPLVKLPQDKRGEVWWEVLADTDNIPTTKAVREAVRRRIPENDENEDTLLEYQLTIDECRVLFRRAMAAINRTDAYAAGQWLAAARSRLNLALMGE